MSTKESQTVKRYVAHDDDHLYTMGTDIERLADSAPGKTVVSVTEVTQAFARFFAECCDNDIPVDSNDYVVLADGRIALIGEQEAVTA